MRPGGVDSQRGNKTPEIFIAVEEPEPGSKHQLLAAPFEPRTHDLGVQDDSLPFADELETAALADPQCEGMLNSGAGGAQVD